MPANALYILWVRSRHAVCWFGCHVYSEEPDTRDSGSGRGVLQAGQDAAWQACSTALEDAKLRAAQTDTRSVVVLDDNLWLRSMRAKAHRLAADSHALRCCVSMCVVGFIGMHMSTCKVQKMTCKPYKVGLHGLCCLSSLRCTCAGGCAYRQVHVDATMDACKQRNAARAARLRVPDHVIDKMAADLDAPCQDSFAVTSVVPDPAVQLSSALCAASTGKRLLTDSRMAQPGFTLCVTANEHMSLVSCALHE